MHYPAWLDMFNMSTQKTSKMIELIKCITSDVDK